VPLQHILDHAITPTEQVCTRTLHLQVHLEGTGAGTGTSTAAAEACFDLIQNQTTTAQCTCAVPAARACSSRLQLANCHMLAASPTLPAVTPHVAP
jgi:hypothetical protein